MNDLPMTLRSVEGEKTYQGAMRSNQTVPLDREPSIKEWKHWRLIDNRFPYDSAFKSHLMLLPKRAGIPDRWQLNDAEKAEFEQILQDFVYPQYDLWFENCPKRRSVLAIYHVHVASYKDSRTEEKS